MTRRILGLGEAAQKVLLAIYRAGFPGQPPAAELAERIGSGRFWRAVATLCDRDLIPRQGGRLQLTAAGRSTVARLAPFHLALVCGVAASLGCIADLGGPPFTEESAPEDPTVLVLVAGEAEYPEGEVCEPTGRQRRGEGLDAGHSP